MSAFLEGKNQKSSFLIPNSANKPNASVKSKKYKLSTFLMVMRSEEMLMFIDSGDKTKLDCKKSIQTR